MKNGFAPILILVGILVIAAVAGGVYYFSRQTTTQPQNSVVTSTPQPVTASQVTPDETSTWKTYTISNFYEFKYPTDKYSVSSGVQNLEFVYPGQIKVTSNDSYIQRVPTSSHYNLYISAVVNKDNLSTLDLVKLTGYNSQTIQSTKIVSKDISVGGLSGREFDNIPGAGGDSTDIYLIKPTDPIYKQGLIYKFSLVPTNSSTDTAGSLKLVYKILATFKFTN